MDVDQKVDLEVDLDVAPTFRDATTVKMPAGKELTDVVHKHIPGTAKHLKEVNPYILVAVLTQLMLVGKPTPTQEWPTKREEFKDEKTAKEYVKRAVVR